MTALTGSLYFGPELKTIATLAVLLLVIVDMVLKPGA